MGLALETILAAKQNIAGGGFENLNPGSGDSFSVRSFGDSSRAWIEEIWGADITGKAQFSIKSPRMHDQTRGILLAVPSGAAAGQDPESPQQLLPGYLRQQVYESDTLTVQVSGTANDDVCFAYTTYYENLPGIAARLHRWEEIEPLIANLVGILVQPTTGVAAYGASVTLSSVDDRLKADTDYALLGCVSDSPCGLVSLFGADTGNLRVGMPGATDPVVGANWFVELSKKYGIPHIPVLNSNNKGNTNIVAAQANAAVALNVTLILAQLTTKLPSV